MPDSNFAGLPAFSGPVVGDEIIAIRPSGGPVQRTTTSALQSYFLGNRVVDAHSNGCVFANSAATNATNLQAIIDSLHPAGGTILLSEPLYCGPIILKPNVDLIGNNTFRPMGPMPYNGAAASYSAIPGGASFLITDTVNPFLTIYKGCTLSGICFYYPGQNYAGATLASMVTYPPTITDGTLFHQDGVRMEYLCFVGATKCISFTRDLCMNLIVDACYAYPLGGTCTFLELGSCPDIARITRNHINPGTGRWFLGVQNWGTPLGTGLTIIGDVIVNGGATFDIRKADHVMLSDNFVFGTNTCFKFTDCYGTMQNSGADWCYTGLQFSPTTTGGFGYKPLVVSNFLPIPHGGTTTANRNSVVFDGSGGHLSIVNMHSFGTTAMNSSVKVSGTGVQYLMLTNCSQTGAFGGTFANSVISTNGSLVQIGSVTSY